MISRHRIQQTLAAALFALTTLAFPQAAPPRVTSFDTNWRFLQADIPNGQAPDTPDTAWTPVDLPHDWAIHGPFLRDNPTGGAGAFAPSGIGWYRKRFTLPLTDRSHRIFVEFDGIMANSDVWINGALLGHRPNGYVSFRYELTPHLQYGDASPNLLAVRADNAAQPASRFYQGAGIYRHVRLLVLDPIHIDAASTFVSTPKVSPADADVRLQSDVVNQSETSATVRLQFTILSAAGRAVAKGQTAPQTIAPGQTAAFDTTTSVRSPALWDLRTPTLYHVKVDVLASRKTLDTETIPFGIREFHFDPDTGFWLNGRNLKIKGVALHSDVGSLGMAAPVAAWEHRLAALKIMGVNAIRTAHNPVAPEFLDLCDRMGFLVMDEMFDQWTVAKNPFDYHLYFPEWHLIDTRDTVRRDRNHPSIILYSAGNEIHDTPKAELAKSILGPLVAEFHKNDPTRPVTQALFRPNVSHDYTDGLADMLDVIGQNYRENEILAAHTDKPSRKIIGTENGHDRTVWLALRDHPAYAGQFIWAGVDYLGESRHWPLFGDASGLLDRTDAPKPEALERQSWWSEQPVVHLARRVAPTPRAPTDPGYEAEQYRPRQVVFHDWTPPDRSPHDENVEVYSNCDQVDLLLNGTSLGAKPRNPDDAPRRWTVPFAAGTLKAIATNQGKTAATETLKTAGKPARLLLTLEAAARPATPDRDHTTLTPAWDNVAYLRATVADENGIPVPQADTPLTFTISGPGRLLATDNADNADSSGFELPTRRAYRGTAIAIVRATQATGTITVTVSADHLTSAAETLSLTR